MLQSDSDVHTSLTELVKRSKLLGSDRSVCNWGGGNTSVKTIEHDFRGRSVDVLWVKGSGSDLAEATERSFTALRLSDVQALYDRDDMDDDEMVKYLSCCMLDPKHPRSSIETLLHAFLPFAHIDHTHPDSVISLCSSADGELLASQLFGSRAVWVPYIRPGFRLSKIIAQAVSDHPDCDFVLMEKHGLVTWGNTSDECYAHTMNVITEIANYIDARSKFGETFGGAKYKPIALADRLDILSSILPLVRGIVSENRRVILSVDDGDDFVTFANGLNSKDLSGIGAACPDHIVHTKRLPLFIDWDPSTRDKSHLIQLLQEGLLEYKANYISYFNRNREGNEQMHDPYPRIILIPGIGAIGCGKSKRTADISLALYHRAVAVMRGAEVLGNFTSLDENESFAVEYWPLELYKLSLLPPEQEFSRKVAYITGAAGGIGSATARRLVDEGGHVVIADLDKERADQLANELNRKHREFRALSVYLDVTNEDAVRSSFEAATVTFGGIDLFVSNAGLASSAPVTETSLEEWNRNVSVLGTGYFLTSREAFRLMASQGLGGNIVFVTSKNAVYAGKDSIAYSSTKAMEAHMARCLAVEGGAMGIRVNSVLPDAVLQGSTIWDSSWRNERAKSYGITPDALECYYRKRTLLGLNVFPEDVAEAILFYLSHRSSKTTGSMISVDGGISGAFIR